MQHAPVPWRLSPGLAILVPLSTLFGQSPGVGDVCVTVYGPLLEPVPNAAVTVRSPDWSLVQEGKTDGSGQFLFAGEEGRWVYCCATAQGMHVGCEFTPPLTRANSPVYLDVKLLAAATIRGTVRDEKGKPIAGAQVIGAFDDAPTMLFKGESEFATSDAAGAFALTPVPLGDIVVRASADGFELGESKVYLEKDATVDVVLKRGKGRELAVVVEGVPPERLPDIECRMFCSLPYPKPNMTMPPRLVRLRLDEQGQCIVRGLPREPELSMIRLEAVGMRFHPQWQKVEPGADGRVTFRLDAITGPRPDAVKPVVKRARSEDLPPSPLAPSRVDNPTLSGVLRDDGGKPRGLTRVRLYADRTGWREAITAEDGTFAVDAKYEAGDKIAFELRNPDWVLVDDAASGFVSMSDAVWREYRRGTVQNLVATTAAKVRGTVKAGRGESAAGLRVLLEVAGDRSPLRRMPAGMGTTDAKGAFAIDGLRPPEGQVWLVVRGLRGTAEAGPLEFGGRRVLEGVELKLQRPLEVTGTVVDRGGKPIAGARVNLAPTSSKASALTVGGHDTLSDAKGRFAFRGMEAGQYGLSVRVRGPDVAAKSKPFDVGEKRPSIDQQIKVSGN